MARAHPSLTIPSSTRYLEDVRHFVETHALAADLSEMVVEQIKIAVDEACTNVIEHAYGGEAGHEITIDLLIDPKRFTVRIQDEGQAFDPAVYQEPDIFKYAQQRKMGGFGVHIMRRLMDEVQYERKGRFNECCLVKFREATENGKASPG